MVTPALVGAASYALRKYIPTPAFRPYLWWHTRELAARGNSTNGTNITMARGKRTRRTAARRSRRRGKGGSRTVSA